MARPRKPIHLQEAERRVHRSNEEKTARAAAEVRASSPHVAPPAYLTDSQKKEFRRLAKQLIALEILSNLDRDALARYIQSEEKYLEYDRLVSEALSQAAEDMASALPVLDKLEGLRDKAAKQCRAAASDLGLTIASRSRLTAPKKEEPEESRWTPFLNRMSGSG